MNRNEAVAAVVAEVRGLKSANLQYNTLIRWVDHLIDQDSDGPSMHYFDRLEIKQCVCWLGLRALRNLYFFLCKVIKKIKKNKLKGFLQTILQEIMKKIILRTSDAWSMRQSSHGPSDLEYYIEDCRISYNSQHKSHKKKKHETFFKSLYTYPVVFATPLYLLNGLARKPTDE